MIRLFFILAAVSLIAGGTFAWSKRTQFTQSILSQALNAEVTLEKVEIGFKTTTLHNLKIKNKRSSEFPDAFVASKVTLNMPLMNLTKDKIVIPDVKVDKGTLFIELSNKSGTEHSWVPFINVNKEGKPVQITHLKIEELTYEARSAKGKKLQANKIVNMEFLNLGTKTRMTLGEIDWTVFEMLLLRLSSNPGLDLILKEMTARPAEEKPLQPLLKRGKEILIERTEETKHFFEGLFSQKP